MDKNQGFFDPYNFNLQNSGNLGTPPTGIQPNSNIVPNIDMMPQAMNPNMYYEQQYMYYRYLTQMLEYKIKLKEWENCTNTKK